MHGGAGNRATVTTDYLTIRQAQDLIAAAQCALGMGKPLTRHLTVRLEQQGIADADAVKAIGRLITLLRDHVRKTAGAEIAYIWSREHGAIIGHHVHILLHLPAARRIPINRGGGFNVTPLFYLKARCSPLCA